MPPGGSTTFVIRFSPSASGGNTLSATISITNNDLDETPYTFDVRGSRPAPEIDIYGNGISITNLDAVPSLSDGTDWGNVGAGISVDHTFTIYNTGAVDLTLSN